MANPNRRSAFTKAFRFINLDHIPGPRGKYYFDYVRHFQKDILGAFTRVNLEYGDIGGFPWPMNSVIIYSPELAKSVLVDQGKCYIKGEQIEELRAVVGNGLATNNDHDSWLKSRALLAREFNNKSVENFVFDFISITKEQFQVLSGKSQVMDICEEMKSLTFKIACQTFLGVDLGEHEAKLVNEAVHFTSIVSYKRIFQFFPLPYWLPTPTHLKFNQHYNNLNKIVLKLITDERQQSTKNKKSILQKLVHAKDSETHFSFNDFELRDEILTLMLAGHETSAHTLTWLLGLLAKHQEVQEKLFAEIMNQSDVSPQNYLESYPYLKCVLLESMRLYPAFPVLSRKAALDVTLGEYHLPKDTNVVIPIYVMQRNEKYWPKAHSFLPERFMDESLEKSYAFMPFSRGQRRCIAELFAMTEMAVIVVEMVKLFRMELIGEHLPKEEASVSLRPVNGMPVRLISRD